MNTWSKILSVALVAQLGLTALLISNSNKLETFSSEESLLGVSSGQVDQISIFEKDKPELKLSSKDGSWTLSDQAGVALLAEKITPITNALFESKKSYPVGRTAIAAKQFKVVDSDFERKVVVSKGGTPLKTLYIGTSPTFKKVHARVDGQDEIYELTANSYEFSTKAADYYDKEALKVPMNKISKITLKGIVFNQKDGKYQVSDLKDGEETNQTEVASLMGRLSNPVYEDLLSAEQVAPIKDKAPVLEYVIDTVDNQSLSFKYFGPLEEQFYALKTEKSPIYFKIRKAGYDSAAEINREKVVQTKAAPAAEPASEPPPATPAAQ